MSSRPRLRWVDALRGACAAIVAFHHARTLFSGVDAALLGLSPACLEIGRAISRRNTEAVVVFFVLSGFSIRLSVEGRLPTGRTGLFDYYARRARRLLPLYWLSLLVAGVVAFGIAPLPAESTSARTLLGNLLFLQTAVGVPGAWVLPWAGNGPLWSLSFEVFFYLCYPWLLCGTSSARLRWATVLAVTTVGFVGGVWWPNPIFMFCAASITWYLGVELAERWLSPRAGQGMGWLVALCCAATALRVAAGLAFHALWVAASAAVLLAGMHMLRGRAPAFFGSVAASATFQRCVGASVWLGSISYAWYLLHVPVMRAAAALGGKGVGTAACALVASVMIAMVAEPAAARFRVRSAALSHSIAGLDQAVRERRQ